MTKSPPWRSDAAALDAGQTFSGVLAGRVPLWSRALGLLGGVAAGCALFLALMMAVGGVAVAPQALVALAGGTGALGLAWLGATARGAGVVGGTLGALAVTGALGFVYAHRNDVSSPNADALVLELALVAFALGHVLAPGLAARRWLAGLGALSMGVSMVTTATASPRPTAAGPVVTGVGLGVLALVAMLAGLDLALAPRARARRA